MNVRVRVLIMSEPFNSTMNNYKCSCNRGFVLNCIHHLRNHNELHYALSVNSYPGICSIRVSPSVNVLMSFVIWMRVIVRGANTHRCGIT